MKKVDLYLIGLAFFTLILTHTIGFRINHWETWAISLYVGAVALVVSILTNRKKEKS